MAFSAELQNIFQKSKTKSEEVTQLSNAMPGDQVSTEQSERQIEDSEFFWIITPVWPRVPETAGYVVSPAILYGLFESFARFTPHYDADHDKSKTREAYSRDVWNQHRKDRILDPFRGPLNDAENLFLCDSRIAYLKQSVVIEGGDWTIKQAQKRVKTRMYFDLYERIEDPEAAMNREDDSDVEAATEGDENPDHNPLDAKQRLERIAMRFVKKYDWETLTESECRAVLSLMGTQQEQYIHIMKKLYQILVRLGYFHESPPRSPTNQSFDDKEYGPIQVDPLEAFEYGIESFNVTIRAVELALEPGKVVFSNQDSKLVPQ